jgi:hypothetical protein
MYYQSEVLDDFVTPALHPDGRRVALMRSRAKPASIGLTEKRLVLFDRLSRAVTPLAPDDEEVTGQLRWVDGGTLLVEGAHAVWAISVPSK